MLHYKSSILEGLGLLAPLIMFGQVWTHLEHLDGFGCIWIRFDTFGCVWMHLIGQGLDKRVQGLEEFGRGLEEFEEVLK